MEKADVAGTLELSIVGLAINKKTIYPYNKPTLSCIKLWTVGCLILRF